MILVDENIGGAIVVGLRNAGFDVKWIAEVSPAAQDGDILELAHREGRILLRDDKDLGELAIRDGRAHAGVILLRLVGVKPEERAAMVVRLLRDSGEIIRNSFTVLDHTGRIRGRDAIH